MRGKVITFKEPYAKKFFFSTDHCQELPESDGDHHWVPVTTYLPYKVTPRPSLPDGLVKNKQDYITIFCTGMIEIPNPDPDFQA